MTAGVKMIGLGHYAPARAVTNAEIESRLGVESGWIARRTGINERRYAANEEALSDLAIEAGSIALQNAGIDRNQVTLLLLATSTPDHLLPPTAPLVAHRLDLHRAGGIDLAGACGGFLYALALAESFVRAQGATVLVIAANILSRRINPKDRGSSALFADAAGAVVLAPSGQPAEGLAAVELAAAGQHYGLISIPGGGSRKPFANLTGHQETLMVISDGQAVFSEAIEMMAGSAKIVLGRAGLTPADVTHFIPHQANIRMMRAVCHQIGIAPERMSSTIEDFGNSSAATIPFTMSHNFALKPYKNGDIILFAAAGAGLTGGAAVWRW